MSNAMTRENTVSPSTAGRVLDVFVAMVRAACSLRFLFMSGSGRTEALCNAARQGEDLEVGILLRFGVGPDSRDQLGNSPLHWAAMHNQSAVVKLLADNPQVDVNARNDEGDTPLHWAAEHGSQAVARYLVEKAGAKADARNRLGEQPVHVAAEWGRVAMLHYLVEELGCNPDVKDDAGMQPVHRAAQRGRFPALMYLVDDRKCAVDVPAGAHGSPFDIARDAAGRRGFTDYGSDFPGSIAFLERRMFPEKFESPEAAEARWQEDARAIVSRQRHLGSIRRRKFGPAPTL